MAPSCLAGALQRRRNLPRNRTLLGDVATGIVDPLRTLSVGFSFRVIGRPDAADQRDAAGRKYNAGKR
jgi:hypothetical protein